VIHRPRPTRHARLASAARAACWLIMPIVSAAILPRESVAGDAAIPTDSAPAVDGVPADMWVFCGQSNSQGWALHKAPVTSDPRVLAFDASDRWVRAAEPLNPRFHEWTPRPSELNILLQRGGVDAPAEFDVAVFLAERAQTGDGALGGVGPGVFFARQLAEKLDRPIAIMHCGVGGSPISQWDPSLRQRGIQSCYGDMLDRIAKAGGKVKGVIFYQGESDAMTPGREETYEQAMLDLIDGLRRDLENPELPFLYVQLGRFVHPSEVPGDTFTKIREIQRRVASLRPNAHMVSAADLPLEDSIHLSFEAYGRLGPRLAEIALTKVYGVPGHGAPIELDSIEVLQPDNCRALLRVRFKGVTGRLRAEGRPLGFELRPVDPPTDADGYFTDQKSWQAPARVIYRVDFDPTDPAAVILGVFDNAQLLGKRHPFTEPVHLYHGRGSDPLINIVDERDIPLPAFGPVLVNAGADEGASDATTPDD
jgi:sialate O-acetylesterase